MDKLSGPRAAGVIRLEARPGRPGAKGRERPGVRRGVQGSDLRVGVDRPKGTLVGRSHEVIGTQMDPSTPKQDDEGL